MSLYSPIPKAMMEKMATLFMQAETKTIEEGRTTALIHTKKRRILEIEDNPNNSTKLTPITMASLMDKALTKV